MFCFGHTQAEKPSTEINSNSDRQQHCSLALLPICTSAIGIITILTTYTFAVTTAHIFPLLPYISDTGVEYPESSIFSLCLDIVAFFLVLTSYIRYKLIGQLHQRLPDEPRYQRIRRVNATSLIVGVVAAGGLMVLANFPEDENLMVHLIGAFFCFAFGVTYCFLHTWLSFKTCPEFSPPWICFLRLCLGSSAAITLALVILFGTALRWNSDECNPQMNYRRTSALFEWLLVVIFDMFFMSFALEFHKVKMSTRVIILNHKNSHVHFSKLHTSPVEQKKMIQVLRNPQSRDGSNTRELSCHCNGLIHILSRDYRLGEPAIPV